MKKSKEIENQSLDQLLKRLDRLVFKFEKSRGLTRENYYIRELKNFRKMEKDRKANSQKNLVRTPKTDSKVSRGLAIKKLPKQQNKLR
jgi:hypothetical protein